MWRCCTSQASCPEKLRYILGWLKRDSHIFKDEGWDVEIQVYRWYDPRLSNKLVHVTFDLLLSQTMPVLVHLQVQRGSQKHGQQCVWGFRVESSIWHHLYWLLLPCLLWCLKRCPVRPDFRPSLNSGSDWWLRIAADFMVRPHPVPDLFLARLPLRDLPLHLLSQGSQQEGQEAPL